MKNYTSIFNVFLLVVFLGSLGSVTFAEDFTFKIPVELKNIPRELNKWQIRVVVKDQSYNNLIGDKTHNFQVNKNYKRTLTIKFDAKPGKNPADAKWYGVFLNIIKDGRSYRATVIMKQNGPYPYDSTKPVNVIISKQPITNN